MVARRSGEVEGEASGGGCAQPFGEEEECVDVGLASTEGLTDDELEEAIGGTKGVDGEVLGAGGHLRTQGGPANEASAVLGDEELEEAGVRGV